MNTNCCPISILLWAMMTFPGLSQDQRHVYEGQLIENKASFLASPEVKGVLQGEKDLTALEEVLARYKASRKRGDKMYESIENSPFFPLAVQVVSLQEGRNEQEENPGLYLPTASAYLSYREKSVKIARSEQEAALRGTIAGRVGRLLEGISSTIGFDYKTNIALIGGFIAKEVIVSSLGTTYSLEEANSEEGIPLSKKLKNDPKWNPLVAFTLIIFIMLYVPCFITVISIRRESSWKWAFFSMGFNLVAAYLVSLAVYQAGLALGLGV